MVDVPQRIREVRRRIGEACARRERSPEEVRLVVVTKSATPEQVREAIRSGCTELGESRPQQLKKIHAEIAEFLDELAAEGAGCSVNWHMVGHLQRNKVRQTLPLVSIVHSVDTLRLAEEMDKAGRSMGLKMPILLQVNVSGEAQKFGVPIGAATHVAEQLVTFENLRLRGMMTMGPLTEDTDDIRSCFIRARELFAEIQGERLGGPEFTELSMGMSNDYEIAVEEGATIVRVGSAIFND